MKKLFVRIVGLGVAVSFSLLFSSTVMAVECKGLSKTKCEKTDTCSWVKSYETKTGKKVEGYCRSKPTKSAEKKATSTKKKASDTKKKAKTTKKKETKKKSGSEEKKGKKKV